MSRNPTVRLAEVCGIESRLVDPRERRYLCLPHVGGANIESDTGDLTDVRTAEEEGLKSGKFLFDDQVVLYSKIRPYLKKVARPDFEGLCSADVYPLRPQEGRLDKDFLFYLLLSETFTDFAIKGSARAGMPKVNREHLFAFEFCLPPLPDQKRIVALLDKAFEAIATAKANAEKNVQNARAVFESYLEAVFTEGLASWERKPLVELCSVFVDSAHRTPKYTDEGIPALRPRDVVGGNLDLENAAKVSQEEYEVQAKRHKPVAGDIVYSRELSFGWASLLPKATKICLSQGMCLFRPDTSLMPEFLLYVLNGPIGRRQAERLAVGTAHPHINLSDIRAYAIPVPSISRQQEVVQQFDRIADETKKLSASYRAKSAALDELKKSLLHQAFSGQL